MQGVKMGVGGGRMEEEYTIEEFSILEELDGVDPNATLRLRSSLSLSQTMFNIPQGSNDTPFRLF